MEERYCQSCGMPMGETEELYGTEADGSRSSDYCSYCYQNGAFTAECTMEEMIEVCIPPMLEANSDMKAETAREMMQDWFPSLKRWNGRAL